MSIHHCPSGAGDESTNVIGLTGWIAGGELSVGRMVKHGSEGGPAGVLLVWLCTTKKACLTPVSTIMTPLAAHLCTTISPCPHAKACLEESLVTRRSSVQGTALHNIWPTGTISKNISCLLFGWKKLPVKERVGNTTDSGSVTLLSRQSGEPL